MSDRLMSLERNLRNAVERRRYAEVPQASAAFCQQAAEEWRAYSLGDPNARLVFDRMQAVLDWALLMLCVSRASAAAELRRVRLSSRYFVPGTPAAGRLRLDA